MAFDDFDVSFDDEDEDALVEEEGPNRTFLIVAIALAAVFLIGLCVVLAIVFMPQLTGRGVAEVSPNEQTNNYNMTMAAETATSALLTQQAPPVVATDTPEPPPPTEEVEEPTATPESEIVTTPTGEGGPVEAEVEPGEGTPTQGEPLEAEEADVSFIEDGEPTPTRVQIEIGGADEEPGLGGPVAVETALPDTGFSAEAGLVGAGLLAMALVVVVVVVRRLRLP